MICINCQIDRDFKDFYGDMCFRCVYKIKTGCVSKKKTCRNCKKELPKSRWVFCATECQSEYNHKINKRHWTNRVINVSPIKWNNDIFKNRNQSAT